MNKNVHELSHDGATSIISARKPAKKVLKRKKRSSRPYPASSFEEAFELAQRIQEVSAGDRVKRETLLQKMERSPKSSATKQLITNSGKYGITTGSYIAEWLELTADGRAASDPVRVPADALMAKYRLAIEGIEPFKVMYEEYKGKRIPSREVMRDCLSAANVGVEDLAECVDLFIVNAKHFGMLQTSSGSEILMTIETVLAGMTNRCRHATPHFLGHVCLKGPTSDELPSLEKICF